MSYLSYLSVLSDRSYLSYLCYLSSPSSKSILSILWVLSILLTVSSSLSSLSDLSYLIYPILSVTYTHADMHMRGRNSEKLRYFGMESAESWGCWLVPELMGQIQVCWIYTPRHMGHIWTHILLLEWWCVFEACLCNGACSRFSDHGGVVTEWSALTMGHEADSLPRSTLDWFTSVSTRTLGEHEHWAMPWSMVGFNHGIYQEKWWEIYKKHPERVI
jgi:hypothetical protein